MCQILCPFHALDHVIHQHQHHDHRTNQQHELHPQKLMHHTYGISRNIQKYLKSS